MLFGKGHFRKQNESVNIIDLTKSELHVLEVRGKD